MKLIIDGYTQEIELSNLAPDELSLSRDDLSELALALLLVLTRSHQVEVADAIKMS